MYLFIYLFICFYLFLWYGMVCFGCEVKEQVVVLISFIGVHRCTDTDTDTDTNTNTEY